MPDMQRSTKKWGKVDRANLARLVHDGDVDINDLTYGHINAFGIENFCHHDKNNFCCNFRDFVATFNLKAEYRGARRRGGKTMRFSLFYISGHLKTPPPTLADKATMMHLKTTMTTHPTKKTPTYPKTTTKKSLLLRQSPLQYPKPRLQRSPKVPPPTTRRPTIALYSLDMSDAAVVAYYNDEGIDYAEVEVHINSAISLGTSCFLLAKDRMSVIWQQAVDQRCFLKEHLWGAMQGKLSSSHSHIIAYCNVVQAMKQNKVIPDAGAHYWGTPQVIRLNQRCTMTPHEAIYPYPMQHKITDNDGIKQHQYNTLAHCRVQLAEQHYTNVGATHYHTIDLFGIGSPQESHSDPPTPPLKRRNKKSPADKRACHRYIEEVEEDNKCDDRYNDNNDDDDGND
jgi:hypothetical protein